MVSKTKTSAKRHHRRASTPSNVAGTSQQTESGYFVTGRKRTSLIGSIRKSAKTNDGRIHMLRYKDKWALKKEGEDSIYKSYTSKASALKMAKELALTNGHSADIVMHDLDGFVDSVIIG